MLPFALVILAVHKKGFKRGIILIIPYMVLVGVYLVLRAMIVDYVFGDNVGQPVFMRLLTMSVATFDYARLLLFPYPLSPFYLEKWYTSFEPKVLLAILFLITIFLLAFKLRKDKVMIFLLLFPFMMLAPAIWRVNTFLAGQDHVYIAERFLYVPAMLFSLFTSYSVARLFKDSARRYMIIGWLSVISIFITIAITSNRMWADDFTLSKKIIEKSPEATFVRNNLGLIYNSKGLTDMAIEQFRTVIKLKPDNYIAYINLGNAYGLKGLTDMAIEQYQTAIKLQPDDPNAYNNLGGAYRSKGLIDKAIEQYLIALRLNANIPEVHYNLGNVYLSKDMVDKAIECYEHAIKLKPDDADIHDNLGFAYHKKGSIKKAEDHFRMADAIRSKQK
ncbi:MAG: tetratricopeptide repeat protein [Nitrospirae bacterium]|nr:tetratricopeptide repeat protein [Nitrospirota bacterium]